jgi:Arc/MetJ-type ribon-helix-helix transcriptional regulator
MDGVGMDSEKITINMGAVDLGKIDLLVEEGFYGNRTDFIRTAIRNQLGKHENETNQTITRRTMTAGVLHFSAKDLETYAAKGDNLSISVVGMLSISHDASPEMARQVIESVTVRGVFRASQAVKDALADRTH